MTSRTRMRRKEVDDVLGGDEMWKHADSTDGEWYYYLKVCSRLYFFAFSSLM